MKDKLLKIIGRYGVMHQLKHFNSEVFELNEAIIRLDNEGCNEKDSDNNEHVASEIADVMVMLRELQYYHDIPDEKINEIMEFKVNRQMDRMKKEDQYNGS